MDNIYTLIVNQNVDEDKVKSQLNFHNMPKREIEAIKSIVRQKVESDPSLGDKNLSFVLSTSQFNE